MDVKLRDLRHGMESAIKREVAKTQELVLQHPKHHSSSPSAAPPPQLLCPRLHHSSRLHPFLPFIMGSFDLRLRVYGQEAVLQFGKKVGAG
ncbi:hypothetical protein ACFX13_025141 [Malus domestica]